MPPAKSKSPISCGFVCTSKLICAILMNGIKVNSLLETLSCVSLIYSNFLNRYTCDSKPGMRTGSCDMTCSPDRITPQCPVFNCISASPGTCGNMRCEVSTYSHVLYWFSSVKRFSVVVINPLSIASFLPKKKPRCQSQCLLLVLSSVIQFENIGCFINSAWLYWKI
jgi:hypothetical protein